MKGNRWTKEKIWPATTEGRQITRTFKPNWARALRNVTEKI